MTNLIPFLRTYRHIILAPHCDDELIGCSGLYPNGVQDVVFCSVPSDARFCESADFNKRMEKQHDTSITLHIQNSHLWDENLGRILREDRSEQLMVWVPNPNERHPLHREVCYVGSRIAHSFGVLFGYYSTDMNDPATVRELTQNAALSKRHYLEVCFKSQKSLFDSDHKFWLFEGLSIPISQ